MHADCQPMSEMLNEKLIVSPAVKYAMVKVIKFRYRYYFQIQAAQI